MLSHLSDINTGPHKMIIYFFETFCLSDQSKITCLGRSLAISCVKMDTYRHGRKEEGGLGKCLEQKCVDTEVQNLPDT